MNTLEHAILAPSSADRWVRCTGSVQLCQRYPEADDTPSSMEGTAAHWVCSEYLVGRYPPLNTLAPNGIAVTDEMIEGAQLYCDSFPAEVLQPGSSLRCENRVSATRIHAECWGTPDADWIANGCINVADYKFGHGYVNEFENYQMICYLVGVLDELPHFDDQTMRFNLAIIQPRCYHRDGTVRRWTGLVADLRPLINKLIYAAQMALSDKAELHVGHHCNHCPAIHACPAAQVAAQDAFDLAQATLPSPMDATSLGLLLRKLKRAQDVLKAMGNGLEEEAEARIRGGEAVAGFGLAAGRGRIDWDKSPEEIEVLGSMFGVDLTKKGLITPTQAKAALKKKGIDEAVISAYSSLKSGALQLTQSDDTLTRRVFGT